MAGEVVKLGPNLEVDLEAGDPVNATVAGGKYSSYPSAPSIGFLLLEYLFC